MDVERPVFMFNQSWMQLHQFFEQLARPTTGTEAERRWSSPDHDLTIEVTADVLGQRQLDLIVSDGPYPTWTAALHNLTLDSEQLAAVADDLKEWIYVYDMRQGEPSGETRRAR